MVLLKRNFRFYPYGVGWLGLCALLIFVGLCIRAQFQAATARSFSVITVNTTADDNAVNGNCTLREAITAANTNSRVDGCVAGVPGADTIEFGIGSGTPTINVTGSAFPMITEPVVINGATGGATRVEVSGANAGAGVNGLWINSGGSTLRSLVLNRFSENAIFLQSRGGNVVEDCYIGTDATGTMSLGNRDTGIGIADSPNNRIGGANPAARNIISGNRIGVFLTTLGNANGNVIEGNFIGTDRTGTISVPNRDGGVWISGGSNNRVGGTSGTNPDGPCSGACNLLSGNGVTFRSANGVTLTGDARANLVQGNFIGTDVTGMRDLGNKNDGVTLSGGPSDNTIGGTVAQARNIISTNKHHGILLGPGASRNKVQGNYVGTNVRGTAALPNGEDTTGVGVDINPGSDNLVGGTEGTTPGGPCTGACNLVSGNIDHGVALLNAPASGNVVQGNFIGTDFTGTRAIPNGVNGVEVQGTSNCVVGGTTPAARNLISGNLQNGVRISNLFNATMSNNVVQGNYIGTRADGTGVIANKLSGVEVFASTGSTIGGVEVGTGNVIVGNERNGVRIVNFEGRAAAGNRVLGNSIHSNGGLGIDVGGDGVTPNDAGDGDSGPNGQQNFPVLSVVSSTGMISGTFSSTPSTVFRLEFFANSACDSLQYGEGEVFLGTLGLTTDSAGNVPFQTPMLVMPPGERFITATATNMTTNETSEFAFCVRSNLLASISSVSAASFAPTELAPESIAAGFGSRLATGTQTANAVPLPTTLLGSTLKVRDSTGIERRASLFFVSPGQINFLIPAGTAPGLATVAVTAGDGVASLGSAMLAGVAPGLFAANANGQGVAAAVVLRVRADGSQSFEAVAQFDQAQNRFIAVPINLGPESDQVFLLLFGTGLRFNSGLTAVTARIGGVDATVTYAGAQGDLVGLDQVNLRAPRSLAGRGEVALVLSVNGKAANAVTFNFR
jgi:uncharacterized protein (TIGR03437 family)